MATPFRINAKSSEEWLSDTSAPKTAELIADLTSLYVKMGNNLDVVSDLPALSPSIPGVHKEHHRFDGLDPLTLALLDPAFGDAMPICGIDNPLMTPTDVQLSTPHREIVYVVDATLKPAHNFHYVLTTDIILQNPDLVNGKMFSASIYVPSGILVTMPVTWRLNGRIPGNHPALLQITANTDAPINVEITSYPASYVSAITEVVYVATDGNDSNDGLSWATAKLTIGAGATLARTKSNVLWIKTGTYTAITDEGFDLTGLSVYGGFAGTETAITERVITTPGNNTQAPVMANPTILQNPLASRPTAISIIKIGKTALYNLTFSGSTCVSLGGAMFIECIITGNSSGAQSPVANCYMWYCTLSNNTTTAYGGGARFCTTIGCRFEANTTNGGSGGGGAVYGGIHRYGTFVSNQVLNSTNNYGGAGLGGTYINCSFTSNSCSNNGGALAAPTSQWEGIPTTTTTAIDCTFTSNNSNWHGGGTSGVDCTRCTFTSNTANNSASSGAYGGGATGGTLIDCIFIANQTYVSGGGSNGATSINCIYIGNRASQPGAAISGGTHYNPIVARHGWTLAAGAFWNNPVIYNGTFLHNNNVSSVASGSYNNVQWRCGGEISGNNHIQTAQLSLSNFIDPLDVVSNVPAGNVAEFDAKVLAHGYDTAIGSPVINAGNNLYNTASTDVRGRTRRIGLIDCGAYEYQA